MLKTTLLSPSTLAVGYSFFISWVFFHSLFSASRYQDLSCCSQSECLVQNSRSAFFAITLKHQSFVKGTGKFPYWELSPCYFSVILGLDWSIRSPASKINSLQKCKVGRPDSNTIGGQTASSSLRDDA